MIGSRRSGKGSSIRHEALIYDSAETFLSVAVPFVRDGEASADPILLALDEPLQRLVLAATGIRRGVTPLPPPGTRRAVEWLPEVHARLARCVASGATRVRLLGSPPHEPWPGWLRAEAAANHLLADSPAWGVCAYDARTTPDEVLDDVERTHPALSPASRAAARRWAYEDPVAVVNRSNRRRAEALEATPPALELIAPPPERARAALTALGHETVLEDGEIDTLCLAVTAVLANAARHGRPPVRLRGWVTRTRLEATVRDAGRGPAEPFAELLPRADDADDAGTLYAVHQAVSDVAMWTDDDGFTVRLTQEAAAA